MEKGLKMLVGKKIKRIFFNEDYLKFETDDGNIVFTVSGDCCSDSVFYDFYGVKELLKNGKVKEVKQVELTIDDKLDKKQYQESIEVYGYQITTEDEEFGDRTSVFSFRNYSNGYYGGTLEDSNDREVLPEIFDDVVETKSLRD